MIDTQERAIIYTQAMLQMPDEYDEKAFEAKNRIERVIVALGLFNEYSFVASKFDEFVYFKRKNNKHIKVFDLFNHDHEEVIKVVIQIINEYKVREAIERGL